ncbi:MAG: hypothetical protein Q8N23_24805 [Archangium sp.]|nr:hypothetical protein [Archangium sp.]MDP3570427.1 hypothetical protein [Archangium sp.]
MPTDIREEIESCDAALREAKRELASLQERAAGLEQRREAQLVALRSQQASIEAALNDLEQKTSAFKEERSQLRDAISAGRSVVARSYEPAPYVEPPSVPLSEVLNPTGWRKGQPWYSRVMWWLLQGQEWK